MRIYNYIFFKIYQILSVFDESPTFGTIIVMCWLFLFNTFTIVDLIIRNKLVSSLFNDYSTIPYTILIIIMHFLYFHHKERYAQIVEEYEKESKKLSIYGTLSVILYIVLSILVFFKFTVPYIGGILK